MDRGGLPRFYSVKNRLFQLYLLGIRGLFEGTYTRSRYGLGKTLSLASVGILSVSYLLHALQQEYDQRPSPSIIIPDVFYRCRIDSYRYWNLSRLNRGKKVYYTHYFYDPRSDFIFFVSPTGQHTQQKNVFTSESLDIVNNPIFERIYRQYYNDPSDRVIRRGNILMAYHVSVDKQMDVDNYVHYKPLTPMDWVRGLWYFFMTSTTLTNAYRYDHIFSRDDRLYLYDIAKCALNPNNKDYNTKADKQLKMTEFVINWLGMGK